MSKRLKHSGYLRGGYKLEVGRMWEIDVANTLRELSVFANHRAIHIVDQHCGDEHQGGERNAVYLSAAEARALGEILQAAADIQEREGDWWRIHAEQADPDRTLNGSPDQPIRYQHQECAALMETQH